MLHAGSFAANSCPGVGDQTGLGGGRSSVNNSAAWISATQIVEFEVHASELRDRSSDSTERKRSLLTPLFRACRDSRQPEANPGVKAKVGATTHPLGAAADLCFL